MTKRMDQITLRYRFVPDGTPMPDMSDFREPIIVRARFEPAADRATPPAMDAVAPIPVQPGPNAPDARAAPAMTEAGPDRPRRIDPPITPVYDAQTDPLDGK